MARTSKRFRSSAVTELMREHDLSLGGFGRRIGVTRSAVWSYVSGVTTPQFATVLKMAGVFDRPLDFFIEREGQGE